MAYALWKAGRMQAAYKYVEPLPDDDLDLSLLHRGLQQNKFHITTQWIQPCPTLREEGRAFEVLLRLEDEDGFWAEAMSFMGTAERHSLGSTIDRWVIRQTLDFLTLHSELGNQIAWLGLNLTGQTLSEPDLPEFLVQQFITRRSLASKICFEVWEADLLRNASQAQTFCSTIKRLGCLLSVQGYRGRDAADVRALSKLPLDFVKLDAQHYPMHDGNSAVRELAESSMRLARLQHARVIITGVEDSATLDLWRRLGADYFQGYAVARPSPVTFSAPA